MDLKQKQKKTIVYNTILKVFFWIHYSIISKYHKLFLNQERKARFYLYLF
jgi:hypothetical protein